MSDNAYSAPASDGNLTVKQDIKGAGWAKFFGVITMIGGAVYALTIILAPVGVPIIFAGLATFRGGEEATRYMRSGDPASAVNSMRELLNGHRINGIIMLVIFGIYMGVIIIASLFGGIAAIMQNFK